MGFPLGGNREREGKEERRNGVECRDTHYPSLPRRCAREESTHYFQVFSAFSALLCVSALAVELEVYALATAGNTPVLFARGNVT